MLVFAPINAFIVMTYTALNFGIHRILGVCVKTPLLANERGGVAASQPTTAPPLRDFDPEIP